MVLIYTEPYIHQVWRSNIPGSNKDSDKHLRSYAGIKTSLQHLDVVNFTNQSFLNEPCQVSNAMLHSGCTRQPTGQGPFFFSKLALGHAGAMLGL